MTGLPLSQIDRARIKSLETTIRLNKKTIAQARRAGWSKMAESIEDRTAKLQAELAWLKKG